MVVTVLAAGRLSSRAIREACDDYARRLQPGLRLVVREVRTGPARASPAERRRIESDRLLAAVPRRAHLVALSRTGRAETSDGLARRLAGWRLAAGDVAFLIGGAYGLSATALSRCDECLSLSSLTLPHGLARLVLLEQLYRAASILQGTPYHKGGES
ncbi:MAG TPA: 23S rRNA (pseudouridine(1915)-N(3))-methyltransferase RlmH [Gemmatimonadales bacterium]|nr:23S rRNA (pseudouridine(1915)-N(3))-methyltransferase RlmH [Gemmatimonadales bacterium]